MCIVSKRAFFVMMLFPRLSEGYQEAFQLMNSSFQADGFTEVQGNPKSEIKSAIHFLDGHTASFLGKMLKSVMI